MSLETWDQRWMGLAQHVAGWSKDRSRKIACVLVDFENDFISFGWNGFPRRVNDDVECRHCRPDKYLWTVHAERNAITNAARKGVSTKNSKMYMPWYPCAICAGEIIQAGVTHLVCFEPDWDDPTYAAEFSITREMLSEAGVYVRFMEGKSPEQKPL